MFSTQSTITTQNKLAIRDGFVEIPDAMRFRQTITVAAALLLVPGSVVVKQTYAARNYLGGAIQVMGPNYPILGDGPLVADQLWLLLPAYQDDKNPTPTDWYQVLRDAAATTIVT
jgi:hypothetical protein